VLWRSGCCYQVLWKSGCCYQVLWRSCCHYQVLWRSMYCTVFTIWAMRHYEIGCGTMCLPWETSDIADVCPSLTTILESTPAHSSTTMSTMEILDNDSEDCATPLKSRCWLKGFESDKGHYQPWPLWATAHRVEGCCALANEESSEETDEMSSNRQWQRQQHPAPPPVHMDDLALTPSNNDTEQHDCDGDCSSPTQIMPPHSSLL
jgi:hypothetical protein